jgi:hypothetical protein
MRSDSRDVLLNDQALNRALRSLPLRVTPAGLTSSLRVIASRERMRLHGRPIEFKDRCRLFFDNLMRPLALPFAGGVCSTIVLFSMWLVPMYPVRGSSAFDVPTALTTEAALWLTAPIAANGGDVVVDVNIDPDGRMIDYKVVCGNVTRDETLRRSIEGTLLLTRFVPATAFGLPVEGKVRLSLRSSHIDVKG